MYIFHMNEVFTVYNTWLNLILENCQTFIKPTNFCYLFISIQIAVDIRNKIVRIFDDIQGYSTNNFLPLNTDQQFV